MTPRYPVYIISKGRADTQLTARCFLRDDVPFSVAVEPHEAEAYGRVIGPERLLVLPFANVGCSIPARNWVWEHAKAQGYHRHWVFDDNIRGMYRRARAQRITCNSRIAMCAIEDFVDHFANIAIAGMNYHMFLPDRIATVAYRVNVHVYSNFLIDCAIPYRWRGRYNEDTDLCLQVLTGGLTTVQICAFSVKKLRTMTMKGGNTDLLYQGDGRLEMARSLARTWPHVVTVRRRFKRPQHVVNWKAFTTPLVRRPVCDIERHGTGEYGLTLTQVRPVKPGYRDPLTLLST